MNNSLDIPLDEVGEALRAFHRSHFLSMMSKKEMGRFLSNFPNEAERGLLRELVDAMIEEGERNERGTDEHIEALTIRITNIYLNWRKSQ